MATDYTVAAFGAELPPPALLLRAFREPIANRCHDRVVLESAHELAGCHEKRLRALRAAHAAEATSSVVADCARTIDAIDNRRTVLVERINGWVTANIPHQSGASLHTESLGAVIDRMAAKWIEAQHALGVAPTMRPPDFDSRTRRRAVAHRISEDRPRHGVDSDAHLQWYRLAELTDGYKDLIDDVAQHRRRLPSY